jgi:uncharacterized membrane protein YfcA
MEFALGSWLLAAGAAVLVGLSKTGMPGVAIPAVWLMVEAFHGDAKLSVGAILPMLLVADVFAVAYYRRHAQWDRLWRLFPYVLAGMIPALLVLRATSGEELRPVLGGLILALLALEICRNWLGWQHVPSAWWFVAATGVLAGFGTALGNAAGPVMSVYLIATGLPKQQFIGTAAWFFFIVNAAKVIPFWSLGMITPTTLQFDLTLVPVVLAGAVLGIALLPLIPQRFFNLLVLLLAGFAGVRLITG